MRQKNLMICAMSAVLLLSCGGNNREYDATGTFEATEITVSAEQNGKLLFYEVTEGGVLRAGKEVGVVDTTQLFLKARQSGITKEMYANQRPDMRKQIAATRQELLKARMEQRRFAGLVKAGAANGKQLDDAENVVIVLQKQLDALVSSLGNSTRSLNSQMGAADIQRLQVMDQLYKCHISSPISGTVLENYVEQGEFATVGKPLFKIADIDNMFLRAYVTSEQLSRIKIGQRVQVFSDYGHGKGKEYAGTVTWIADKSEFTPKTILTDDERADLVYAVKIKVRNDGYIKIGMYGEVCF